MPERLCIIFEAVGDFSAIARIAGYQAAAAADAGWNVTVVSEKLDPSLRDRVEWRRLPVRRGGLARKYLTMQRSVARLLRDRDDFNVVHGHQPQVLGLCDVFECHFLARVAAERVGPDTERGFRSLAGFAQRGLAVLAEDRALGRWDQHTWFVHSAEPVLADMTRLYGRPERTHARRLPAPQFAPVGVEERAAARKRYGRPDDELVVGYLGGGHRRKGYDRLLQAVGAERGWHLLLGGLHGQTVAASNDRVTVTGLVDDVPEFLAACDVVAVPSRYEVFGMVAVEAASRGVPVIATDEVGVLKLLERYGAGRRWDPATPLGLLAKELRAERDAFAMGGARLAAARTAADCRAEVVAHYERVAEEKSARRSAGWSPSPRLQAAPTQASVPARRLVFVSLERWDEVWRRNQFFCRELAGRGWQILFVEPAADVSGALRRGRWSEARVRGAWCPQDLPGVRVVRPRKWLPATLAAGRRVNAWRLKRCLTRWRSHPGWHDAALWINDQAAGFLVGQEGAWRRVVYDITDDWSELGDRRAWKARVRADDAWLCGRADSTIVCSSHLFELKRPLAERLWLVPNGVDLNRYAAVGGDPKPGQRRRGWRGPVLGYTGTTHPDRVDVALLAEVARRWPGTVVMVGPVLLSKDDRTRLTKHGVRFTGPLPYAELPEAMTSMDVLIVPHRVTAFTESLNPLKLWEYLASGKPIVSTRVAGFRDYPSVVALVDDAAGFVAAATVALDESAEKAAARRQHAADHGWPRRADTLEDVLLGRNPMAGEPVVPPAVGKDVALAER